MKRLLVFLLVVLLPLSLYGASGGFSPGTIDIKDVGSLTPQNALAVDATGATSITISSGKSGIIFQNTGTSAVWAGDSTVSPANNKGIKILPNVMLIFRDTKSTFTLYFKCASGNTSTMSTVEFSK